jgi:hypothetical protein
MALVAVALLGGCGGHTDGTANASATASAGEAHVSIPDAGAALVWGNGPYGVVLLYGRGEDAGRWSSVAQQLANDRMTVAAPSTTSVDSLRSAIAWFMSDRGILRVAVLAAGDAARSVQRLGVQDPSLIDQAIVISPPAGLDWSAEFPKLFVASRNEPAAGAAREAAAQAAGTWNVLLLVDGSASSVAIFSSAAGGDALKAVLRRLDDRR